MAAMDKLTVPKEKRKFHRNITKMMNEGTENIVKGFEISDVIKVTIGMGIITEMINFVISNVDKDRKKNPEWEKWTTLRPMLGGR